MTEQATPTTVAGKKPSHIAYHIKEANNGKSFWNRIGAAWTNKNGGFTVQLECVPLDGRIVCNPADKSDAS